MLFLQVFLELVHGHKFQEKLQELIKVKVMHACMPQEQ